MKIAFILDPIESLNCAKDTSLALIESAVSLGACVYLVEYNQLGYDHGSPFAVGYQVESIRADSQYLLKEPINHRDILTLSSPQRLTPGAIDLIFMRKDPPFDACYLSILYLLRYWVESGVRVCNDLESLFALNEKCSIGFFPDCITDTLISASIRECARFLKRHSKAVLKPLDGMGGSGIHILRHSDPSWRLHVYAATKGQHVPVMLQSVLPLTDGDKRLIIFHGEALPFALARFPAPGGFKANLAAGGQGSVVPLTQSDYALVDQIQQTHPVNKVGFIGLDVIDGCLSEINITSPTCLRHIQSHTQLRYADRYVLECMKSVHRD